MTICTNSDSLSSLEIPESRPSLLPPSSKVPLTTVVEEVDEEGEISAKMTTTATFSPRQSRLRRLSSFFSPLMPPTYPQSPGTKSQTVTKAERAPSPAPSRLPPPVPDENSEPTPSKLQKAPTLTKNLPFLDTHPIPFPIREKTTSLAPPTNSDGSQNRAVSSPAVGRSSMLFPEPSEGKLSKRSSWLPGSRNKSKTTSQTSDSGARSLAWVITQSGPIDYTLSPLTNAEKVGELWDEQGDTLVYLFPRSTGRGASFKIKSFQIAASQPLLSLLETPSFSGSQINRNSQDSVPPSDPPSSFGTPPYTSDSQLTSPTESPMESPEFTFPFNNNITEEISHLYFPINLDSLGLSQQSPEDLQRLLDARNLFAFLSAQPIVCTKQNPHFFHAFSAVSRLLEQFEFTNYDRSNFGEQATECFNFFIKDLKLADVRTSPEKTIEALIMAERMKSRELYHEAFTHAAGKYPEVQKIKSSLFAEISQFTQQRLERASQDLQSRQRTSEFTLTEFHFPSLFAGIAASKTSAEAKVARFHKWQIHYSAFQRHMWQWYKDTYGQWPPKPNSKKHHLVEGGLNRMVLRALYADFCSLYDFLVDRESLTTRTMEASAQENDVGNVDPAANALRKVLSEFDRSSPPVNPPIPFDIPKIPTMASIDPKYPGQSPRGQHKASTRKLKDNEYKLILAKSHNLGSDNNSAFLQMYKNFEDKEANGGKSTQDLADQRYGYWIFIYAVLQSLPMLVIDAEDLTYTEGVEYFLCQPPLGRLPWVQDASLVNMAWFQVAGSQGYVSMPSDIVDKGPEAVYRRSHCWTVAEKWLMGSDTTPVIPDPYSYANDLDETLLPLDLPPAFDDDGRPQSRGRRDRQSSYSSANGSGLTDRLTPTDLRPPRTRSRVEQRNSIALGLERLPIAFGDNWSPTMTPPLIGGSGGSRNASPMRGESRNRTRHVSTPSGDTMMSMRPGSSAGPLGEKKGQTFDDIFKDMGVTDKKKKKKN